MLQSNNAHSAKASSKYHPPNTSQPTSQSCSTIPLKSDKQYGVETRGLLRALLREAVDLPDGFARQWVKQHTLSSFRAYGPGSSRVQAGRVPEERILKKLRDGRRALSKLQLANGGHIPSLQKILMHAYGRTGKRRMELMRPLLRGSEDGDIEASHGSENTLVERETRNDPRLEDMEGDEEDTALAPDGTSSTDYSHDLPQQLLSLLQSQMQHGPPTLTRSNPRKLKPTIPELNTWLRPMPQKRVKNMQKQHYAKLLDQVLPPLPQAEWDRLKDLATERTSSEPHKPKSSKAGSLGQNMHSAMGALDVAVRYGKPPLRLKRREPRPAINRRTMRRMYAKVFSQCPLMQYDETRREWNVTWGEQLLQRNVGKT